MKVFNCFGALKFGPTLIALFRMGLSALLGMILLTFLLWVLNTTVQGETTNAVVQLPSKDSTRMVLSVDPPTGTLDGITIDHMEVVTRWNVGMGNGAISATLTNTSGYSGQAVQLSYNLGVTIGAWVQLRRDFSPALDLSVCDHLRLFYRGTTTNTLQVGLVSATDHKNYFSSNWDQVTQVPWWTYATWDFQDFRNGQSFTDTSSIEAIFISVKIGDQDDVGGLGSFAVDELQCLSLNITSRTVPSDFEPITIAPTVTLKAADWISDQQQSGGLLKSWQEESWDSAWLYPQALGLIVLSDNHHPQAHKLANTLHVSQNLDGSWYAGYHYLTNIPITMEKPVGANAWTIYALKYYSWRTGVLTAAQDAWEGAEWLADLQRPDGCLPAYPGDTGAPTEPNLSAWWAFKVTDHLTQANLLQDCLLSKVWYSDTGRFKSSPSATNAYHIFLDNQTWGASFLKAIGENAKALQALSYARWTLATCSSDGSICGFDGAGPFSVWNEGTLQYVAARGENSQYYWDEMVKQQDTDGGLRASPDNFSGYIVWLPTWRGVAPTAWLYYPGTGGPFYTAIAVNDSFTTDEDITLTVTATGVFSNDIGLNSQPLTATLESSPSHSASFALAPDGSFTYTPKLDFNGNDSFTYRATDGALNSNVATVIITVKPVNDPPTLDPIGNKTISENNLLTFTAIATDTDVPANTLTFSLDVGAPEGASINPFSGDFAWTPTEAQGPGIYTVTVRVTDDGTPPLDDSETITITVTSNTYLPIVVKN